MAYLLELDSSVGVVGGRKPEDGDRRLGHLVGVSDSLHAECRRLRQGTRGRFELTPKARLGVHPISGDEEPLESLARDGRQRDCNVFRSKRTGG